MRLRVLLSIAEPHTRAWVRSALAGTDWAVFEASDAHEARQRARAVQAQAWVVDAGGSEALSGWQGPEPVLHLGSALRPLPVGGAVWLAPHTPAGLRDRLRRLIGDAPAALH